MSGIVRGHSMESSSVQQRNPHEVQLTQSEDLLSSFKTPVRPGTRSSSLHSHSASPLKLFGQAKRHINKIFNNLVSYIDESSSFLTNLSSQTDIIDGSSVDLVGSYKGKVASIGEVVARNQMKVAFFGRTSNGKSTTINAMLRTKILPSGIGHTTNCFLQVEGSDESQGYLLTDDSQVKKPLHTVSELANALSHTKLKENNLIRIVWPKDKCSLLKDDVILVDSPGIDVSPNLDSWIDNFCLDADVFVLVVNAESTLMQTEKNFFLKVNDKLSKPNVFILNNRWDASASEPETMNEVRHQHMERNVAFLVDELKVCSKEMAADRVFFVSARETLVSRLKDDIGTPTPTGSLQEGYEDRLFEFATFEQKFEQTISKSAVKTKFAQHTERAEAITRELKSIMKSVESNARIKRQKCIMARKETLDKVDYIQKQTDLLSSEIKDKIKQMVDDVSSNVSKALNEEIRRLSLLVDEFEKPFHPDLLVLKCYKEELHVYVEDSLSRRLQGRCSAKFNTYVDDAEKEITERMSVLLTDESRQQVLNLLPQRDFEIAYRLDARNLCADFQEDIHFKFSLGLASLMKRFMSSSQSNVLGGMMSSSIPQGMPPAGDEPIQQQEIMMSAMTHLASLTSRSTVGILIVTGIAVKAAGWKVIAISGAIYGAIYAYERLTWTKKAQERAFKQQYVDFASKKLRMIVDLTSRNCSHQVQQELSATFARLCNQVDLAKNELEEDIRKLSVESSALESTGNKAKSLRMQADLVQKDLDNFSSKYLSNS